MRVRVLRVLVAAGVTAAVALPFDTSASATLGPVTVVSPPTTPAFGFDAPDPHVVRVGDTFYAYTTGTQWGPHIGVLRSTQPNTGYNGLIPGSPPQSSAFAVSAGTPLQPWQVAGTTESPGVFFHGGQYVMYYGVQTASGHGGRYCLSVATSSTPSGPFTDRAAAPWLCQDALGGVTDPSPFVDARGNAWLYFRNDDDANPGTQTADIYVVRLSADGLSWTGSPTLVFSQGQHADPNPALSNPQMVYVQSTYMLLYTRASFDFNTSTFVTSQYYTECSTLAGPCTLGATSPLLAAYSTITSPGSGTLVQDAVGAWWLAYDARNGVACPGYGPCERKMFVASVSIPAGTGDQCRAVVPIAGYRLVASDGGIFSFGNQPFCGSTGATRLNRPILGMATTVDGGGYWLVASDGGIFSFGNAGFHGSTGALRLNEPIVGMARTSTGRGYWLVASDGGIFSFGDAVFHGSTGALRLNQPIVGMAATSTGNGYWLVARDGGIFSFGDAVFHGSTGALRLNQPILGMAATSTGNGYWLYAADGGIFSFGDAVFHGSTGALRLNQPVVGMAATPTGNGYWLVARDGGIFSFGDAVFHGSTGALRLNQPVVGMS